MKKRADFPTEADLVAAFVSCIDRQNEAARDPRRRMRNDASTWTIYHETGGYDLLMAEDQTGVQVGLEAKLVLNLKVINQVLPYRYDRAGPDYRAVLVPSAGLQRELGAICHQIGVGIVSIYDCNGGDPAWYAETGREYKPSWNLTDGLPDERSTYEFGMRDWHPWLPIERCRLPDYVPDVVGGKPSPVALTDWKIRAIKLLIILERRGHVTRRDMKALSLSPTRWTAASYGYLLGDKAVGGYVACTNTPDLRRQHPTNYAQIEADYEKWSAELEM